MRKFPALFYEFVETGTSIRLGYKTPGDLRNAYPAFWGPFALIGEGVGR